MELTLAHIELEVLHPVIVETVESADDYEMAIQRLEYLRDEINKALLIIERAEEFKS